MRFVIALLAIIASPAMAQNKIAVRSGEHGTFTRLVIDAIPPEGWSAAQNERTVTLNLPNFNTLATSGIFARIPRTRLLSTQTSGSQFTLRLGCDCPVQVFSLENRVLVIDIRDPNSAPVTQAIDLAAPPAEQVAQDESTEPAPTEMAAPPVPNLDTIRDRLVEQLTRAADQGLLSLSDTPPEPEDIESMLPEALEISEPAPEIIPTGDTPEVEPRIDIRTAFERPQNYTPPSRSECTLPTPITEGTAVDRYNEYIKVRGGLYREFDTIDRVQLRRTVLLAIGLGLGTEAQLHLEMHGELLPNRDVLWYMAGIVDGRRSGASLPRLSSCDGASGFWSRLTDDRAHIAALYAAEDLETLAEIPPEFRVLMAEHAAEHWLELSMPATAQRAFELAQRTGIPLSAQMQLISAKISQMDGNYDRAERQFNHLAGNSGIAGLQARIGLVEIGLTKNEPIARAAELDLAATAFQMRGTELGRTAIRLLASIRARSGNLSSSLHLLTTSAQREPEMAEIWQHVAAELIIETTVDSPDYARAVLNYADFLPAGSAGDSARIAAAQGLDQLGLPTDADWIAPPTANRAPVPAEESLETTLPQAPAATDSADTPTSLASAQQLIEAGRALRLSTVELISAVGEP
ncbi:hypothetical protein SAMN06273572_10484 [Monaibacterium marinum]|uniref:Uncharacterized protein n=1 Tax=Pontivivens marinum TaxID=1690039 RepID=A0A2C9CSQ3_9RHOB|nr:hypothetical protein [Monaibacterium marinum]SOH94386.1 hypothetical protein SAMN06273572_10484 [Monaibacterium marinum]